MSEEAGPSDAPPKETIASLSKKIHAKLACDGELAVKAHSLAVANMRELKRLVEASNDRTGAQEACMLLLFSGISCWRRIVTHSDPSSEELADLKVTTALLFVLQLLLTPRRSDVEFDEIEPAAHETDVPTVTSSPCEALLRRADKVVLSSYTSETGHENDSADAICRAAIALGHFLIDAGDKTFTFDKTVKPTTVTLDDITKLSSTFFRSSAVILQTQSLHGQIHRPKRKADDMLSDDFLTLDAASLINDAGADGERLEAIAALGESEVGQQVFKDIIISFLLPNAVLGVRKTHLLPREVSEIATSTYPEEVGLAHENAMNGAEWSYTDATDPIVRAAALLSGVAVLYAGKMSADEIKRSPAFQGRLMIHFLEVPLSKTGEPLIAYSHQTDEWVCFTLSKGRTRILLRQKGFQGLGSAVLLATKKT